MHFAQRSLLTVAFVGFGYLLGSSQALSVTGLQAQVGTDVGLSQEATKVISEAYSALQNAKGVLEQDGRYKGVSKSLNVSAIAAGGVDAVADLEAGRGVDPETFAALYAEDYTDEIAPEIGKDDQGRITYKGRVVRMYSVSRLKQMYQERLRFTGDEKKP